MKKILQKIFPGSLWNVVHWLWAWFANVYYGKPSEKMLVVGVTGTNGKSSTCLILARIFEAAGLTVGLSSGLVIKIGEKEWLNPEHMTMPGRHYMHRRLKHMVDAGCHVAIVETTSEGIKQWRHVGINYDAAVFTNLAPEHLQSHGTIEKYRAEKQKIFEGLGRSKRKSLGLKSQIPNFKFQISNKSQENDFIPKISVVNADDEQAGEFLKYEADRTFSFGINEAKNQNSKFKIIEHYRAFDIRYRKDGTSFKTGDTVFKTNLLSEMNVYNALAALSVARSLGIDDGIIQQGFAALKGIPGRLENIENDLGLYVFVDHAHTPDAYEKLFSFLHDIFPDNRMIAVFGSAGGSRDSSKRPKLGAIAARYCDVIVLTEEDSYETSTMKILDDIEEGILRDSANRRTRDIYKETERRGGIELGISLARPGDVVLVLGKGAEPTIIRKDSVVKWDDRRVVRESLVNKVSD